MADDFSLRYANLLTGSYDCVDRIVLNAFFPLGHNAGGFRVWWRHWHDDSDAELDNTHLMRLAGRFARRVKAWGAANAVPVIFCKAGERKHRIAEEYLATHEIKTGVFLVLAAKAPAPVWKVKRSAAGRIVNIERRTEYVNHYSFHIIDPVWGHVTIKMSGHPPFGAQIILNGHEYVARQAQAAGIAFTKAGNCFTAVADPAGLARIADALSQDATVGRLSQVCRRWIYSACLCFGLDLDEQQKSGFVYGFAVYQLEYSRNLIFADGHRMQRLFDTVVDRTRSRLDVPKLRTLFGAKARPHRDRKNSSVIEAAIETPSYDLTVFKLHFARLTTKACAGLCGYRISPRRLCSIGCPPRRCWVPPGSAASTSTNHACVTHCAQPSRWPRHRTGSPSRSSSRRSTGSPDQTDADYSIRQAAYDLR